MDWNMVSAVTAMMGLVGIGWAASLRVGSRFKAHDDLLAVHEKDHEIHFAREAETNAAMARTVTLLDQVEKRVSRIEDHEDSGN